MPTTKRGKLQVIVCQVDWTGYVDTLWPVNFSSKAGVNLFSLTCNFLQGNKSASDHGNNIMVNTLTGNIILDCQIKTCDGWAAGVDFLCKANIRGQYLLQPYLRIISLPSC